MKNLKLGNAYINGGTIIRQDIPVESWKKAKELIGNLLETQNEKVTVCFKNTQNLFKNEPVIYLESDKKYIKISLSCDIDFITDLLTTDIVKLDVKKIVVKKRKEMESIFKDPYEVDYIVRNNEHHICSYSFHTDSKLVLKHFMETVSVKAIPSGKLDTPTNKKLVKLNNNALRRIRKNYI